MKDQKKSFVSNQTSSSSGKQKLKQLSINVYLNGRSFSGKTCIAQQLMTNKFVISAPPTSQQHFQRILHCNQLVENESFKVDIWDLGGCDELKPMRASILKRDTANKLCLVVYDVGHAKTFQAAKGYIQEWMNNTKPADRYNMVLVANKIDFDNEGKRVVSPEQGISLAQKYNIIYQECSAKTNIEHIFTAAFLLKCSQSAARLESMNQYLHRHLSQIEEIETQQQFISKQCIQVREMWESKIGKILGVFERKFSGVQKKLIKILDEWLQDLRDLLVESSQYNKLMIDISDLNAVKQIMGSALTEEQSMQDSVLSNSPATVYISYHSLLDKLSLKYNSKQKVAQQQIQIKIHRMHNKITQQKTKFLQKLNQFTTQCFKNSDIDIFLKEVQNFDVKDSSLKSSQSEATTLSKIRDSWSISNFQKAPEIQQEYKRLCKSMIQQRQLINKLQHLIYQMVKSVNNLATKISQEYEEKAQDHQIQVNTEQFLIRLIDFYVKHNAEQFLNQNEHEVTVDQNSLQFAIKQVQVIRMQFEKLFKDLFENMKTILMNLQNTTVVSLQRRRKLKIYKQYYKVLSYWHNLTKEQAKKESKSESKIGSLFSKIFGNKDS